MEVNIFANGDTIRRNQLLILLELFTSMGLDKLDTSTGIELVET
jgi:hypothetical protein